MNDFFKELEEWQNSLLTEMFGSSVAAPKKVGSLVCPLCKKHYIQILGGSYQGKHIKRMVCPIKCVDITFKY